MFLQPAGGKGLYFERHIDQVLANWAEGDDRKPLVLRGARQTGKSSSVRFLGRSFDLFLELNLERYEDLALVRTSRSPADLLKALAARHNLTAFPDRTLLFLDEVQESPEAIHWLRFFREDHPQLSVIAAGSLLEVRLQERGFSFPVGRVTFRTLHPLSFQEFLHALGKDVLAESLRAGAVPGAEIAPPLHLQALGLLRDYLLTGGMPEAVARWVESGNPAAVRQVQADLIQAFAEDIQKYRSGVAASDLEAAFENLPHHYGLRFRYENFAPGFKSQRMKDALGKLEAALLITRVWPSHSLDLPLTVRPRSAPKLLPLDVGLAVYTLGTGFQALSTEPLERLLDGRLAEIFAGQQLLAGQMATTEPLFFWVSESAHANAETDFLLPGPGFPVPVEVKSGASGALKSLHQFLARARRGLGIRLHAGMFADERLEVRMAEGPLKYRLLSLPLYLAEEVPAMLRSGP
ncbi:MAG TPA: AAA family ATPase [Thermoanaerobaculia bacterium]|nr:AAA family ATPase [Thermoanaerobaculia bacterium]